MFWMTKVHFSIIDAMRGLCHHDNQSGWVENSILTKFHNHWPDSPKKAWKLAQTCLLHLKHILRWFETSVDRSAWFPKGESRTTRVALEPYLHGHFSTPTSPLPILRTMTTQQFRLEPSAMTTKPAYSTEADGSRVHHHHQQSRSGVVAPHANKILSEGGTKPKRELSSLDGSASIGLSTRKVNQTSSLDTNAYDSLRRDGHCIGAKKRYLETYLRVEVVL